jgi:hypothetical protein
VQIAIAPVRLEFINSTFQPPREPLNLPPIHHSLQTAHWDDVTMTGWPASLAKTSSYESYRAHALNGTSPFERRLSQRESERAGEQRRFTFHAEHAFPSECRPQAASQRWGNRSSGQRYRSLGSRAQLGSRRVGAAARRSAVRFERRTISFPYISSLFSLFLLDLLTSFRFLKIPQLPQVDFGGSVLGYCSMNDWARHTWTSCSVLFISFCTRYGKSAKVTWDENGPRVKHTLIGNLIIGVFRPRVTSSFGIARARGSQVPGNAGQIVRVISSIGTPRSPIIGRVSIFCTTHILLGTWQIQKLLKQKL